MDSENVVYHFELEDRKIEFDVATSPGQVNDDAHPEWARLSHRQCECCPLKESDCAYCPAATRINEVIEAFADNQSTEQVKVTVTTAERCYFEECDLQVGINSLMGLMMATSGCPVLKELGAMASFHIPFCSTRETLHRTVGSYLIQQYFKQLKGEEADWELKHLKELYGVLEGLNQDFSKRIQSSATSDALSNAIIMFFATSVVVASSLDEQLARHERYLTNTPSLK
ncbi:hypothetical protein QEH59_02280 [Coraliomargarita sp. SDUM461004]|uniref:Uncharacterized protein n=1 Tax=Thalassobacterium sedimentorum TaxID=3041258 RepID=A0ABU1AEN0_9BACT|nr:hypothetical protein [Coraliomargarita sp. SDUM461004]MDQ8193235.1 hypothetical protein [Coraliomargarita sp. SDUM461004]